MTKLKHVLLSVMFLAGSLNASDQVDRKLVHREDPEYPVLAARMALHGMVKVKVWISPDGSIRRLEYIGGHPVLAESALKAVKSWKYVPSSKESNTVVELKF